MCVQRPAGPHRPDQAAVDVAQVALAPQDRFALGVQVADDIDADRLCLEGAFLRRPDLKAFAHGLLVGTIS